MSPNKSLRGNSLHIDLDRINHFSGYCQCFACFTSPAISFPQNLPAQEVFKREYAAITQAIRQNADRISQVFHPLEIEENRKRGIASAILTIEGPAGFHFDPEKLEELFHIGFRMTSLGWNESNVLIGSNITGGGLTDLGREYVKEAQRLGMLVDVSHCSDEGFWDILNVTQGPLVASHSNSRKVWEHSRNLSDDMFLALCATGGVVGMNLYAGFQGENPDLDTACDHLLHWLELDPGGKHIALGGDLDGCDQLPAGFTGVESYSNLLDRLRKRGVSGDIVENISWNNALSVMKCAFDQKKN